MSPAKPTYGKTGWATAVVGIPVSILLTALYTAGIKSERLDNACDKLAKVEVKVEQALKASQENKFMFSVIQRDIGEIKRSLEKIRNGKYYAPKSTEDDTAASF